MSQKISIKQSTITDLKEVSNNLRKNYTDDFSILVHYDIERVLAQIVNAEKTNRLEVILTDEISGDVN